MSWHSIDEDVTRVREAADAETLRFAIGEAFEQGEYQEGELLPDVAYRVYSYHLGLQGHMPGRSDPQRSDTHMGGQFSTLRITDGDDPDPLCIQGAMLAAILPENIHVVLEGQNGHELRRWPGQMPDIAPTTIFRRSVDN